MEVFRKISIKNAKQVYFDVFKDMLKEIFFVKETEDTIIEKQKEIKILDESNLMWSVDKKKDALKFIEELQIAPRDHEHDRYYFKAAMDYIQSDDLAAMQKKIKSVRIPFGSLEQGQKFEQFSHEPFDIKKQVYVPEAKMGNAVDKKYDRLINDYNVKKAMK